MEYREEISGHDRVPRMEEAGVIQNLFSSCDRGMTLHAPLLGKIFTALLGLDLGVTLLIDLFRFRECLCFVLFGLQFDLRCSQRLF